MRCCGGKRGALRPRGDSPLCPHSTGPPQICLLPRRKMTLLGRQREAARVVTGPSPQYVLGTLLNQCGTEEDPAGGSCPSLDSATSPGWAGADGPAAFPAGQPGRVRRSPSCAAGEGSLSRELLPHPPDPPAGSHPHHTHTWSPAPHVPLPLYLNLPDPDPQPAARGLEPCSQSSRPSAEPQPPSPGTTHCPGCPTQNPPPTPGSCLPTPVPGIEGQGPGVFVGQARSLCCGRCSLPAESVFWMGNAQHWAASGLCPPLRPPL